MIKNLISGTLGILLLGNPIMDSRRDKEMLIETTLVYDFVQKHGGRVKFYDLEELAYNVESFSDSLDKRQLKIELPYDKDNVVIIDKLADGILDEKYFEGSQILGNNKIADQKFYRSVLKDLLYMIREQGFLNQEY